METTQSSKPGIQYVEPFVDNLILRTAYVLYSVEHRIWRLAYMLLFVEHFASIGMDDELFVEQIMEHHLPSAAYIFDFVEQIVEHHNPLLAYM